jgi:ribosomal protein S18 acetylase RimI-like enzyme
VAIDDRRRARRRALQVSTWRGDDRVAVLSPVPDRSGATTDHDAVAREVDRLRGTGVRRILTGALHAGELEPFLANGFAHHEHLHLLRHDLRRLPLDPDRRAGSAGRRARRRDRPGVLEVDQRAFDEFWALDRRGLDDAVRATPTTRFRVVRGPRRTVIGYAVTGRASERGYLQRLAVDPGAQGAGIGRTLVVDALAWLRRSGARTAVVNTQAHNHAALHLYRMVGFVDEPEGLTVLTLDLADPPGRR